MLAVNNSVPAPIRRNKAALATDIVVNLGASLGRTFSGRLAEGISDGSRLAEGVLDGGRLAEPHFSSIHTDRQSTEYIVSPHAIYPTFYMSTAI